MKEIRICEIRADAAAGAEQALRLEGRPIVYDQPTKINDPAGAFIEVIRAGALEMRTCPTQGYFTTMT